MKTSPHMPVIGVTMDYSEKKHYSDYPWFVLRENYITCFESHGALVIPISYNPEKLDTYLEMIDGLVVTGGNFDHDPSAYGQEKHARTILNTKRSQFDLEITRRALDKNIPFFGICAGMQALNIVRGGTLYQSIPDQLPHALNHSQEECRHIAVHDLEIKPNTLMAACHNHVLNAKTNTSHLQAIQTVGENLIVSGICPDGVIEAIEDPSKSFCIGVQWHPEFCVTDLDKSLIKAFIKAAQASKTVNPEIYLATSSK